MPLLEHVVTGLSKMDTPVCYHCQMKWDLWGTGNGIGFSPSTLVLPSQYHFTNALHSFIHLLLQPQKLTVQLRTGVRARARTHTHAHTQQSNLKHLLFSHFREQAGKQRVNSKRKDT